MIDATDPEERAIRDYAALHQHVKDFIRALDRGYFHCDQTAFVDALREAVA